MGCLPTPFLPVASSLPLQIKAIKARFVVVVIPSTGDQPYKSLKQLLGKYGIPSQFVVCTPLSKHCRC